MPDGIYTPPCPHCKKKPDVREWKNVETAEQTNQPGAAYGAQVICPCGVSGPVIVNHWESIAYRDALYAWVDCVQDKDEAKVELCFHCGKSEEAHDLKGDRKECGNGLDSGFQFLPSKAIHP